MRKLLSAAMHGSCRFYAFRNPCKQTLYKFPSPHLFRCFSSIRHECIPCLRRCRVIWTAKEGCTAAGRFLLRRIPGKIRGWRADFPFQRCDQSICLSHLPASVLRPLCQFFLHIGIELYKIRVVSGNSDYKPFVIIGILRWFRRLTSRILSNT